MIQLDVFRLDNLTLQIQYLSETGDTLNFSAPYGTAEQKCKAAETIKHTEEVVKAAFARFLSKEEERKERTRQLINEELLKLRRNSSPQQFPSVKIILPEVFRAFYKIDFNKNKDPLGASQLFPERVRDGFLDPNNPPWAPYEDYETSQDDRDKWAAYADQENEDKSARRAYVKQVEIEQNDESDEEETPEEIQAFLDSINIFKNQL